MKQFNDRIVSPGGSFSYIIEGPVCILYDREQLPWPCCSLQWKGKQPSWNRVGKRFVPDMAASRCHAYAVKGNDLWGTEWKQVLIQYNRRLSRQEKNWWYWRFVPNREPPNYVEL